MMVQRTLSLGAVLCLAGCGPKTPPPDWTELDQVLRTAVESRQVPAVIAVVATRDGIAWSGAEAMAADAIVAIASMTKPVTSVAVMQLVEAGQVELDEPAATYVPGLRNLQVLQNGGLRPAAAIPTVRQLLTHTSGFAYEFLNAAIAGQVQAGQVPSAFIGTDGFLSAPLVSDPGVQWEYGISTDWLGRLVEAVSGESLDVYFRTRIFEPLGMGDTYFHVPAEKQGRMVPTFSRREDGTLTPMPPGPDPPQFLSGGSGLYSTAADYMRFARALLAGGELDGRRILSAESVALMAENHIGDLPMAPPVSLNPAFMAADIVMPGTLDAFGLGFGLNREAGPAGRAPGTLSWAGIFNTFFWVDRQQGVAAVLLTQMLPFLDGGPAALMDEFERTVYRLHH